MSKYRKGGDAGAIMSSIFSTAEKDGVPTPEGASESTIESYFHGDATSHHSATIQSMIDNAIAQSEEERSLSGLFSGGGVQFGAEAKKAAYIAGSMSTTENSKTFSGEMDGWTHEEGLTFRKEDLFGVIGIDHTNDPGQGFAASESTIESYENMSKEREFSLNTSYNLSASIQDEFSRAFFGLKTISPSSVGYVVGVTELSIIRNNEHGPDGDPLPNREIPLLRALKDPSLLSGGSVKMKHIFLPGREKYFMDPADVAPSTIPWQNETIEVAPLRTGIKVNLMSLSQSTGQLGSEALTLQDTIDPSIKLKNLYVKFGADIIKFSAKNIPGAVFRSSSNAGDQRGRRVHINVEIEGLVINKDKKDHAMADLTDMAIIKANELGVFVTMFVSGYVDLDTASSEITISKPSLSAIRDIDDDLLAKDHADFMALSAIFDEATLDGYDLDVSKTNANHRELGNLIDQRTMVQPYTVPYGDPVSSLKATGANIGVESDQVIIAALTKETRMRGVLSAAQAIIDFDRDMDGYSNVRDGQGNPPAILGPLRYKMDPVYLQKEIQVSNIINSIQTSQLYDDVAHTIINSANQFLNEMLEKSNILYAYEEEFGSGAKPKILIGTTAKVRPHLEHPHNKEKLFPGFDWIIVTTTHPEWRTDADDEDKMFISFDNPGADPINPFRFGTMAWGPVSVFNMNIRRGESFNKEVTVTPRQEFNINAVVATMITIKGLKSTIINPVIPRVKAVP